MRVIAGTAKGRRLRAPKGEHTRPTSDRVRESLFASLGDRVPDAVVLDLWSGPGTLGIEALSRGAARAVHVERDRHALTALRANLEATGFADRARVVSGDVDAFAAHPSGGPFTLVFVDPPYALDTPPVWRVLKRLLRAGALAEGATISVERQRSRHGPEPVTLPAGVAWDGARAYGDTILWRLVVDSDAPDAGAAGPGR